MVPISGTVTFKGEPPGKPGVLRFVPVNAAKDSPQLPATAKFDASGQITGACTFEEGDGVTPGVYQVCAACWETEPCPANLNPKSILPENYQSPETSGWEVVIKPGNTAPLRLDVLP